MAEETSKLNADIAEMVSAAPLDVAEEGQEDVKPTEDAKEEEAVSEEAKEAGEEGAADEQAAEGEEGEAGETEKAEEPSAEVIELRAANELLRAQAEERDKEKADAAEVAEAAEAKLPDLEPETFIVSDEDYDKLLTDKGSLNALLNAVMTKTRQITMEEVLRRTPILAAKEAHRAVAYNSMINDFFRANKDLLPQRKLTGIVFTEFLSKHVDKTYQEVLELVAPEVRKRLKMTKPEATKAKPKDPSFAPGTKGKKAAPTKPSGLKSEIDEILNVR